MPEVIVLRAGYSRPDPHGGGSRAACSISLVLGDALCMLVDPGGPADRGRLLAALAAHALSARDIEYVVCTHGHLDHVGNLNLFPRATFLSGHERAIGDRFWPLELDTGPLPIATGVQLMATPGHTSEDISVLVATRGGLVAISGDAFENGDPTDTGWRAYSRNPRQQRRSRAAVLALADYIVPGHGPMFATREYRR
jgi:glyoxylase-like metal-dependent hydrolase (beta-lactamase superfamily II)